MRGTIGVDLKRGIDIIRYTEKTVSYKTSGLTKSNLFSLVFIVSGTLKCDVEGSSYVLKEDNVLIINDLEKYHAKKLINILEKMEHASYNDIYGDIIYKLCSFLEALVYISSIYVNCAKNDRSSIQENKIVEILNYINRHLSEDLTLSKLESLFYINKFNLSRSFKKYTGTSIHNFIVYKRILYSQKLLLNNYSVTEACAMSGFNDYTHFIRAFRRHTGVTPLKYSKTYQKADGVDTDNESCNISIAVSDTLPDLIITNIQWLPAEASEGDRVLFSAVVKNIGNMPTPPGIIIGVGFSIKLEGVYHFSSVTWSDNYDLPLLPGSSVILTSCGGISGSDKWDAVPGKHIVTAFVNDVNRIKESSRDNNTLSKEIIIAPRSE